LTDQTTPSGKNIDAISRGYAALFPWLDEDDVAITYWLLEIHTALLAAADQAFENIGQDHTRVRYGILRSLLFADDQRQTHNVLVEKLRIPPSTVSFMVDSLEKDGLVERKPHRNRRAAWIQLTTHGIAVAGKMVEAIAASMHEMTDAAFTGESKRRFRNALIRFYEACQAWTQTNTAATTK
jgi:DNA-binding MarR family transcriptional regulator